MRVIGEEENQAYYDFVITTNFSVNFAIRSYNRYLESNKVSYLNIPKVIFLERAKKPKIGDNLIKIEKVRTTYKTTEIIYDGKMKTTGYFICPKTNNYEIY